MSAMSSGYAVWELIVPHSYDDESVGVAGCEREGVSC